MEPLVKKVAKKLKTKVAAKYRLQKLKIFGSSARGDRMGDSDIDIFIHLRKRNQKIEEDIYDTAYELELEYDCLIDLIIVDDSDLAGIIGKAPIFQKILSEGASV